VGVLLVCQAIFFSFQAPLAVLSAFEGLAPRWVLRLWGGGAEAGFETAEEASSLDQVEAEAAFTATELSPPDQTHLAEEASLPDQAKAAFAAEGVSPPPKTHLDQAEATFTAEEVSPLDQFHIDGVDQVNVNAHQTAGYIAPSDLSLPEDAQLSHLSSAELEVWQQQFAKSVKADDAEIPIHLWDTRVWRRGFNAAAVANFKRRYQCCPLTSLRQLLLRRWQRNVYLSFIKYLSLTYGTAYLEEMTTNSELQADCCAGRECLWRVMEANCWEWPMGSRLLFWRWSETHRLEARGGYPPYVQALLPKYRRLQPYEKNPETRAKVKEKLNTVRKKKYISKGRVHSLTYYFSVPKGENDVRMVYDASRSQLNKSLWAPNFGLPTIESLTRSILGSSWMGDLDIGEMFLNFCLHPDLQPYCGVDVKPYFMGESGQGLTLWERWVRCVMGLKPSPYICIKALLIALEVIRGNRLNPLNPFHWHNIVLNLPGSPHYNPSKPRLLRLRQDGRISSSLSCYVDDLRAAAAGEDLCWEVMHVVSSKAAYLDIQVATRKTRPPSRRPGPWAGSEVISHEDGVAVALSPEKWKKTKEILQHTLTMIDSGDPIPLKTLESYRGSLVYVQRTYPAITPYLKGYHLTIDSWRPDRDKEGWTLP
jgi:hypothetical protein